MTCAAMRRWSPTRLIGRITTAALEDRTMKPTVTGWIKLVTGSMIVLTGLAGVPTQQGVPIFDPANFVIQRPNLYFPLRPGSVYTSRAVTEDGVETDITVVTGQIKIILGVRTVVVHDSVFTDGELTEDTFDWYASDQFGNVWYFGEDSREIDHGQVVSTEGSWEAGVNNARAGIIMEAHPHVGDQYRQEFAAGVAEDMAEVVSLDKSVPLPAGWPMMSLFFPTNPFEHCIKTRETSPFEPTVVGWKYYAPGIGVVLELERDGNGPRVRNRLLSAFIPQ
jgi:hypothetical protein